MDMPRPGPEHLRLHAFAGGWTGMEKVHPSPWDPHGGAAEGRIRNEIVLDGFVVVQDYEQRRDGRVSFTGHGVMSWDAASAKHCMHWWDSLGGPVSVFTGAFAGDRLVLTAPLPQGASRASFDLAEAARGRYSFLMEVSPDGTKWFPFLEGEYRRA